MTNEATDVAAPNSCEVGGLNSGGDLVILINVEECALDLRERKIALGDEPTTERVLPMHAIQHDEELDLVHALLERQLGWRNTVDLVACVDRARDVVTVGFVNPLTKACWICLASMANHRMTNMWFYRGKPSSFPRSARLSRVLLFIPQCERPSPRALSIRHHPGTYSVSAV